ncbi:MAG TPA: hypothetical protein VF487_20485 [Chitinophagaceae bacterium]
MKGQLLLLLFVTIIFSCKKENDLNDLKNKISGKWELRQIICGECANPITYFLQGNGNVIVLSTEGVFERRIDDSITFQGSYVLQRNKECNKATGDIALSTNEGSDPRPLFVQLDADNLQLSTPYCYADGATSIYRRVE